MLPRPTLIRCPKARGFTPRRARHPHSIRDLGLVVSDEVQKSHIFFLGPGDLLLAVYAGSDPGGAAKYLGTQTLT